MKAYKSVIKAALADGYSVHVDQGEGDKPVKCGGYLAAVDAVEAVEEAWILVVRPSVNVGKWVKVASLYVIWGWGMADDETIADWHCHRDPDIKNWADRWSDAYYDDNSFAGPLDSITEEA